MNIKRKTLKPKDTNRGENESYKKILLPCESPRHLKSSNKKTQNTNSTEGRTTTHIIILPLM